MPSWNSEANDLFLLALDLPNHEARLLFIKERCADNPVLARQVLQLLEAHDSPDPFMDSGFFANLTEELTNPPLTQLGPYRIVELIGEGGMGMVYKAVQESPIKRTVAIKIIKPGLDTRQVIRRFETEREALSRMEHPHIARVLDSGATSNGRPYFVMELVQGEPITEYCNKQRLPRDARLALFRDVCNAVQHAHQKGIIHRDLKPSNILVTRVDRKPLVKVIDFGIAKAIGEGGPERTFHTGASQMIGTPLYMSPEQAMSKGEGIDTRSDVYSLGVLLYELLTGTTPFDRKLTKTRDDQELRRLICEYDPVTPSHRVGTLTDLSLIASEENDPPDPRKISRALKGDLDWIVMKALEKDRNRRYGSASELAADLDRYLSNEPVEARPPSQLYRLQKLAKRNRAALTTISLVLLAMIVGTALATWQAIEASRQRDAAQASSRELRKTLYAGDIFRVNEAYKINDARNMREVLIKYIPTPGSEDLRTFEWYYLWRNSGMAPKTVLEKDYPIYGMTIDPTSKLMGVHGARGTIDLLSYPDYSLVRSIDTQQVEVNRISFTSDGKTFATAGDDGTVAIFNTDDGSLVTRFKAHEKLALHALFDPTDSYLITGGTDGYIKVWPTADWSGPIKKSERFEAIDTMDLISSSQVAFGDAYGNGVIWNYLTGKKEASFFDIPEAPIKTVVYSPLDKALLTCHNDGHLSIRNIPDLSSIASQSFPDIIHSAAVSQDPNSNTRQVAIGDRAGSIYVLPMNQADRYSGLAPSESIHLRARQWQAHENRACDLKFTPDYKRLLSCGHDGKLYQWELADLNRAQFQLPNKITEFLITPGKPTLGIGSKRIFEIAPDDPDNLKEILNLNAQIDWIKPGLTPDRFFVHIDNKILEIDRTSLDVREFQKSRINGKYTLLTCNPTLGYVAWCETNHKDVDRVWLSKNHGEPEIIYSGNMRPGSMVITDDGHLLYNQQSVIAIMNLETLKTLRPLKGHRSGIFSLQLSPADDSLLMSTSTDRTMRIWNWRTGETLFAEVAHSNLVHYGTFANNGDSLVTIGPNGSLRFWDWRLNRMTLEVFTSSRRALQLQLSPDGRVLYIGDQDGDSEIIDTRLNSKDMAIPVPDGN